MKIALGIEYNGSAYSGWQFQDNAPSVQEQVEKALAYVADHAVTLHCAGRTDAGVHAMEQVVHFETTAERNLRAWILGSNTRMPEDIRVIWATPVVDAFHARYSATARRYRYLIQNSAVPGAVFARHAASVYQELDVLAMHSAAQFLLGENDFSSFRAAGCQSKTPFRQVHEVTVGQTGEMIHIDIQANAFLHHMVRNIVGSLIVVGKHEKAPEWIESVLKACDRTQAGITAPACGLYLLQAQYPVSFGLPQQLRWPLCYQG